MMKNKESDSIGVLVARFQTPVLLDGHREVLEKFLATSHSSHMLVLGIPATKATMSNPFDFNSRKRLVQKEYGDRMKIVYIKDCNNDGEWSHQLDDLIDAFHGGAKSTIYGMEESVIKRYCGVHYVVGLETTAYTNWQEWCKSQNRMSYDLESWMQGVAWATQQRYPTAYATVDCAIFDDDSMTRLWMARKPLEPYYRFVGGFVDPLKDDSHEDAAVREAMEETCMGCKVVKYLGSFKIDDWRYRDESDKIITSLFAMVREGGVPKPHDDIGELKLVDLRDIPKDFKVMPEHVAMFDKIVRMSMGEE
jgi:bifunctional NMN adenylyltransferase/nudix hydrolase